MTNPQTRYRLDVRLNVAREERMNPGDDYWRPTQERLEISESLDLGPLDFMGVTKVLAALHDAVVAIRNKGRKLYPACVHHQNASIERYEPCSVPGCQPE